MLNDSNKRPNGLDILFDNTDRRKKHILMYAPNNPPNHIKCYKVKVTPHLCFTSVTESQYKSVLPHPGPTVFMLKSGCDG